jgi:hypothetical protein
MCGAEGIPISLKMASTTPAKAVPSRLLHNETPSRSRQASGNNSNLLNVANADKKWADDGEQLLQCTNIIICNMYSYFVNVIGTVTIQR